MIRRSTDGEDDAFVALMHRHSSAVWAYLVRRLGPQAAEDVLAEVWVAAYTSQSGYDHRFTDARPWLFGIARHTVSAYRRRLPREEAHADMTELAPPVNPWPDLEHRLDGPLPSAELQTALLMLPVEQREVLLLVAWEGLKVVEVARVLGIPAGTARYRLYRARRALRAAPEIKARSQEMTRLEKTV